MSYEILNESFLLKNVENPGRIIDRINSPELVVYKNTTNDFVDRCILIVTVNKLHEDQERKLTEYIKQYHKFLYTKDEDL